MKAWRRGAGPTPPWRAARRHTAADAWPLPLCYSHPAASKHPKTSSLLGAAWLATPHPHTYQEVRPAEGLVKAWRRGAGPTPPWRAARRHTASMTTPLLQPPSRLSPAWCGLAGHTPPPYLPGGQASRRFGEGLEAGRRSDAALARRPAPYRLHDHAAAPATQPPIANPKLCEDKRGIADRLSANPSQFLRERLIESPRLRHRPPRDPFTTSGGYCTWRVGQIK